MRLILSRSLAYPQGKILGAAIGTISRSLSSASLSSSAALPLESGCKGTDFFRFRNFYCILFCRIFSGFLPNSLIYFMLYSIFFIVVRKRMWNDLHYIIRASAYVCANGCRESFTKDWKKQLQSLKLRTKSGKRNGVFTRTRRNFLRFRYEKHTVPQRKTYGSHGGNIRFAKEKHKNYGNITRFSTRGFLKKLDSGRRNRKDNPSRKGIKKGVPLNSNLC